MAKRPVFYVGKDGNFEVEEVDFEWFSGFSKSQKQKSIKSLHQGFLRKYPQLKIIEISTKSEDKSGMAASAFNLKANKKYTVEQVFQASKVYKNNGPQMKLLTYEIEPREMKNIIRKINMEDTLTGFLCYGREFPLEPKTYFYNWLYINSLNQNVELSKDILKYDAFTDIEFNPQRSINCQAEACSIFVSLKRRNLLDKALKDMYEFLNVVYGNEKKNEEIKLEQIKFNL